MVNNKSSTSKSLSCYYLENNVAYSTRLDTI